MTTERKKKTTEEKVKRNTTKKASNTTRNTQPKKNSKKKTNNLPLAPLALPDFQTFLESDNPLDEFLKITACYVRVSTDAQAEQGYSIPDQTAKLQAFCTVKGWENVKFYTDPGFSGSNLNRPAMQELIADAMAGRLKAVIVFKLDRLSRSQKDTLYLIEDVFLPNEVDFVSISESLDTSTPFGRAMIGILSVFAQLERENIYLRTRIGMKGRISSGFWRGGGNIPFGYDYDKDKKTLVPNADAPKVQQIFDLYIKGYSCQKIADMLGLCNDMMVRNILKRRTYCGYVNYKEEEYQGVHEPLISEETFDIAAAEYDRRSRAGLNACGTNTYYLLAGLVYCGDCEARMRYMKWGKYFKIICYSHTSKASMVKNPDCPNMGFLASDIEELVINKLFGIGSGVPLEEFEVKWHSPNTREIIEKRISDATTKLKRLYGLYSESGDSVIHERIFAVRNQIRTLQQELDNEDKHSIRDSHVSYVRDRIKNVGDIWPHLTPMERQTLIRDCVDKIIIHHDGSVEIFFSFSTFDEDKQCIEDEN